MGTAAVAGPVESSLATEILSSMASLGHTPAKLFVAKGDLISLQDGRGAGVHVLRRGLVKILRFSNEGRVILLDLIGPGDVFGEMSFLSPPGAPATQSYAEALEATELLSVPSLTFDRLLRGRPALAIAIARLLGERCDRLERRLEAHVFHKVPTRLVEQLLELAERYGEEDTEGTLLPIPLSQQDLGNLIGASREIVSLTLSEFKRRGLIATRGRRLVLRQSLFEELGPGAGRTYHSS